MWRKFCGFILKILGWKIDGTIPQESKCIILGAPHTSIWDVAIAYLYYEAMGGSAVCMVKKEAFIPPLSWILKGIGCIPVDRSNGAAFIRSIIAQINSHEHFHLAIAPEGTRKPVRRWKTGFHLIAKETGLPVYLAYFDWGRKRIGIAQKFELSDDATADMKRIQQLYEDMNLTGKHPEKYLTH